MKPENRKILKETTEKEIMVFCPNCVTKERNQKQGKYKLSEIIKANSKPISSMAGCKGDGEKYFPETDDRMIWKHFKCEKCGDEYVGQYNLTLEKNLTLDEAYKVAKDTVGRLFTTYRVIKSPCFKCLVMNLPGAGKPVHASCSSCMPDFQKKKLKNYRERLLAENKIK
jgi:hypothetical protein